jgi:phosphoribosyl 1,2-cyclic phosphodiesterase
LKFKQIYSGSSGNLFTVTAANGKRILIECGVTWSKLQKALDFNLKGIEGCLVSHQHKDHSKAIKNVMTAGINVYALECVFQSQELAGHHRAIHIRNKDLIKLDSFQVFAFSLNHDVPIVGFIVHEKATGEKLLFATDTSHIIQKFNYPFDIIAIECSFDEAVLQKRVDDEDIHISLAKRLWGSHLEKDNCLSYIRDKCNLDKCREIYLLHLSGDNIDKRKTKQYFKDELFLPTFIVGD